MNFLFKNNNGGGGGGSYTFSTGLTNTSNVITNNLSTGVSGGQSLVGSTSTNSGLIIKSTTGVGSTGADIVFQTGNNGSLEIARFYNNGNIMLSDLVGIASSGAFPTSTYTFYTSRFNSLNPVGIYGGGSLANPNLYFGSNQNVSVFAGDANGSSFFAVSTGAAERLRIIDNGNIGIGLSIPESQLHISASSGSSGSAPLQFNIGVFETVPRDGTFEYAPSGTESPILTFVRTGARRGVIPVGNTVSGAPISFDPAKVYQFVDDNGDIINLLIAI